MMCLPFKQVGGGVCVFGGLLDASFTLWPHTISDNPHKPEVHHLTCAGHLLYYRAQLSKKRGDGGATRDMSAVPEEEVHLLNSGRSEKGEDARFSTGELPRLPQAALYRRHRRRTNPDHVLRQHNAGLLERLPVWASRFSRHLFSHLKHLLQLWGWWYAV